MSMNVRIISETATAITIGWDAVQGQEGFVSTIDGSETLTDGKRHANTSKTQTTAKIGKVADDQPHNYGVNILGVVAAGFVRSPQPAPPPTLPDLTPPVLAAFYYPWFPETWTVGGVHVAYHPTLGYYDSADVAVIDQHIKALDYAGVDLAIFSWWGQGMHREATIIPLLLERTKAAGSNLRWGPYYEKEGSGNPTTAQLQSDLDYLRSAYAQHPNFARVGGKPVVHVYSADDSTQDLLDRWAAAASGWWYSLKVFSGYKTLARQPSGWHQYSPNVREDRQAGYSFAIAPGRTNPGGPIVLARDPIAWVKNCADLKASGEPWRYVTTFNEWGEGTAVEDATEWASSSGFGVYLDALRSS